MKDRSTGWHLITSNNVIWSLHKWPVPSTNMSNLAWWRLTKPVHVCFIDSLPNEHSRPQQNNNKDCDLNLLSVHVIGVPTRISSLDPIFLINSAIDILHMASRCPHMIMFVRARRFRDLQLLDWKQVFSFCFKSVCKLHIYLKGFSPPSLGVYSWITLNRDGTHTSGWYIILSTNPKVCFNTTVQLYFNTTF